MHLYTTFIMMKSCPWTELQAKFHRTAVEGIDDSVHVESGRLMAVQVSRLCNQYLTEVVIDAPVLDPVDMCQSRALDIFDSDEYNLKDRATNVASMLRRLSWPVNWAKLITMNWSLHLNSMACRLPLYLFTHLSNSYLGMSDII